MFCNVEVHDAPAVMRQHQQDEQYPAGDRRNGEEIDRGGCGEMIGEKRPPCLRVPAWVRLQQTRHRAF